MDLKKGETNHKMRKSLLIFSFLLFLLVLTPLMSAQPIFQQSLGDVGIDIEFPKYEFVQQNQPFVFGFHIFNATDGVELFNTTVDCKFFLHDPTGTLIISLTDNANFTFANAGNVFLVNIPTGTFDMLGEHSYVFQCEDSSESIGGFVSTAVFVTVDGRPRVVFSDIFMMMVAGYIILMFGAAADKRLLKIMAGIILIVSGVLTLYPGWGFVNHASLVGLALGSIAIAVGFFYMIEDSFGFNSDEDSQFYRGGRVNR